MKGLTERGVYAASPHDLWGRSDRRRTHLLVRILKRRKRRAPSAEEPRFCGSKTATIESFRLSKRATLKKSRAKRGFAALISQI